MCRHAAVQFQYEEDTHLLPRAVPKGVNKTVFFVPVRNSQRQ